MFVTATLVLLTAGALPAISLEQFEQLSHQEVGEQVLAERAHGPVLRVEPDRHPIDPPGTAYFRIFEEEQTVAGGCRRSVWHARFGRNSEAPDQALVLKSLTATTQVALAAGETCADSPYAHVNPGLGVDEALAHLRLFRSIAEGSRDVRFDCRTMAGPDICASPVTIRAALSSGDVGIITRAGTLVQMTLGVGSGLVTMVRFKPDDPTIAFVEQTIPPPF